MLKRHVKNCDKVLDNRNHVLQSAQSISDKCRENISKEHLNILDSRDIINNNNKMEKCARFLQEKIITLERYFSEDCSFSHFLQSACC